jgi:opacity protein-like surface antigen
MKPLRKLLLICSFLAFGSAVMAQSTIPATGGNGSGSGGTVSYTVGQVVYTTISGTTGSVTQGVQQPYEISIVTGLEEAKGINLIFSAYPNPAGDFLTLKIENYDKENLSYRLYDLSGNLLVIKKIVAAETSISMGNLLPGTYFLKVTGNDKVVKTFKIIKK